MNARFRRMTLCGAAALMMTGFAANSWAQTAASDSSSSGTSGNGNLPGMMGGYGPGDGYGSGMMGGPGGGYGPGMMGGYGSGYGPGMMGGYGPGYGVAGNSKSTSADRFTVLKQELKITGEQEPAWKSYTDAVTAADQTLWNAVQSVVQPGAKTQVTPDGRFAIMSQMVTLEKQNFDDKKVAAAALLSKLTPYQRGQASVLLPGLAETQELQSGYGYRMGFGGYGMWPGMMGFGE